MQTTEVSAMQRASEIADHCEWLIKNRIVTWLELLEHPECLATIIERSKDRDEKGVTA